MFLPGESQGGRGLVGSRLWGRTESDTTEVTWEQQQQDLAVHSSHLLSEAVKLPFVSSLRRHAELEKHGELSYDPQGDHPSVPRVVPV